MTLAVLGDSIAFGQGATNPRDTIAARLEVMLGSAGIPTQALVLAVPGARSDALAAQVDRALAARAQVVLVIIGANDLTHFVPPGTAASQLGAAVATLRGAGQRVVVAPAPDLSALPGVPVQLRSLIRGASTTLHQAQRRAALAAGGWVVDAGGELDRFAQDPSLLSADRFHPSSAGYTVIARPARQPAPPAIRDVGNRVDARPASRVRPRYPSNACQHREHHVDRRDCSAESRSPGDPQDVQGLRGGQ
jgi:lysophospholipase L1-like esterase